MSVPDFPAIVPSSRTFTHGRFPANVWNGARGAADAVRQGIGSHEHQLGLTYLGLTMEESAAIRTHFNQALSTYDTFDLPTTVWCAEDPMTAGLIDGHQWRYASPPSYVNVGCALVNVSVELVTAPWSATFKGLPNHLGSLADVGLGVPVAGDELAYNGSSWWSQP